MKIKALTIKQEIDEVDEINEWIRDLQDLEVLIVKSFKPDRSYKVDFSKLNLPCNLRYFLIQFERKLFARSLPFHSPILLENIKLPFGCKLLYSEEYKESRCLVVLDDDINEIINISDKQFLERMSETRYMAEKDSYVFETIKNVDREMMRHYMGYAKQLIIKDYDKVDYFKTSNMEQLHEINRLINNCD